MRRKFLSVVLCVCMMMMTMVPFAFATGIDTGSTTEGASTSTPSNSSSGAGGGGSVSTSTTNAITNETDLRTALESANDEDTITISGTISINAPLVITKTVTLTGGSITASDSFTANSDKLADMSLISLKTAGKVLTLKNITLDAKQKTLVVFSNAGKVVVDGATITGGKTNSYVAGVYMTSASQFEMNSGSITGNEVGDSYKANSYTQYAADLWIGANANGALTSINGGTIGNIFVNSNAWSASNPGGFTMTDGNVTNLYVEYDAGYGASFTYQGGTIENLYISTTEGNGNHKTVTPVIGMTYTGGQTSDDATAPVAQIDNVTYATLAKAVAAAEDGKTIDLLKNTSECMTIDNGKKITLDLNGKTLTVPSDCGISVVGANSKLTITGNGNITCTQTPIAVSGGTVEIQNGTINSETDYCTYARDGGTIIVNGGTLTSQVAVLSGNNTTGNMNFFVNGGTLTARQGPAIYQSGQCKLNITGGTLNGGISLRMGQVNISGGTINAMTDVSAIDMPQGQVSGKPAYTYSGNVWFPDALYVIGGTYTSEDTTYGNSLNLNITGGTFNCTNGKGSAVAIYDLGRVAQTAKITISGNAKFSTNAADRNACDVLKLSDIGVTNPAEGYNKSELIGKVSSSISGGYFTTDPSSYLVANKAAVESDLTGYNYMVADKKSTPATVAAATPTVDTAGLSEAEQSAATEIANKLKSDAVAGDGLTAAANTVANNNTVTADEGKTALEAKQISAEANNTRIVVQTYMDIDITGIKSSSDTKTLTLDITPMYRTVATTADTDDQITLAGEGVKNANAVPVGPAGKLTINKPVTVKIPLPTGFADDSTTTIYVQHKGYEYTATVSKENDTYYATFVNPHGFSAFTISASSIAEAKIGDTSYMNFQDAVNAANDSDTITVLKDGLTATMSGTSRTIKVKANTGVTTPITVTVNGETKTISDTTTPVEFTYTRPSHSGSSSSGSTTSTYNVNVNAATNGAVAADKKTAAKGTTVTVTASPSKGYVVDAVKVVDKDGKDVAVTEKDGKYVFTMPASAVTVTGSFKAETPAPVALPFTDVKIGNWFYDAVKYAYEQGLMTGTSATTFAPNGTMNRAMIVTVLYRLEKSPAVTGASKFTDVPAGQWYSDAVAWAAANKIVNGYDETTFGPMNAVTREQMAAILFRYEQVKGLENVTLEENLNRFPDQNKISAYAIPALQWAVGQKIINGNADGTLDPTGTATRAQVAQIFTNLLNQ